ncbi:nitrilase-related carbon-nitrogen hydrolase [Sphingomonas panni]|uniref:nitrilase-related carbon-nitrogen hydrolase n=1 Tax=Sphingomonas panni TaxID=237612 RepID=UPI001F5B5740|nr:nitrilase-related carbon-nitrogen hydrolase [Sphingomonas panni]
MIAAEQAHEEDQDVDSVRTRLVALDRLMRRMPKKTAQRYKAIPEPMLRDLAVKAGDRLQTGLSAWLPIDILDAAAAQVRALDHFLFHHRPVRGRPNDPNEDFLCYDLGVHAIPRAAASPPSNPDDVGTKTYRRRGVIWHRLLPRVTSSGHVINLQWHRDMFHSFRSTGAQVVSALFDGLLLERDETFERFVVSSAHCSDEHGALEQHVAAAFTEGAVIAVWPELTMPEPRRRMLADLLKAMSAAAPLGTGPSFAAAGSWHEVEDRKVRNRMHVLSRSGQPRFHHDKSIPLESKTLGTEELEESDTLAVLIMEDALVAFAICRDFCEDQIARAYLELDVDLVVVPSYGDVNTIDAHRHMAQTLATDFGTRTFVVQQVVPEEVSSSGLGYVLPPETSPTAASTASLVVNDLARRHPISFKRV